jgi:toxin-antitoxin system PIN domain toxin
MTSCDTNILFAALDSASARHHEAREFLLSFQTSDGFALCELVLVELYGLLRNPTVCRQPYGATEAAQIVQRLRSHPHWAVLDYPGPQAGLMKQLWSRSAEPSFPYRRIYDLRLALTLRHHGVTEFATRNVRDFQSVGFPRVWDPLA